MQVEQFFLCRLIGKQISFGGLSLKLGGKCQILVIFVRFTGDIFGKKFTIWVFALWVQNSLPLQCRLTSFSSIQQIVITHDICYNMYIQLQHLLSNILAVMLYQ